MTIDPFTLRFILNMITYWGVMMVGVIAVCIGLYLEFVASGDIPLIYTGGFYILGVIVALLRFDLFFPEDTLIVAMTRAVGITLFAFVEIYAAWIVAKRYEVHDPVTELKRRVNERRQQQ